MRLGAAPEIDRHTLQLSEACPAVATSPRVMNSHVDISRLALLLLCTVSACASPEHGWAAWTAAYVHIRVHDAQTGGHGWAGLTELQGVTIDFWGGPQLQLWPQAARPL